MLKKNLLLEIENFHPLLNRGMAFMPNEITKNKITCKIEMRKGRKRIGIE